MKNQSLESSDVKIPLGQPEGVAGLHFQVECLSTLKIMPGKTRLSKHILARFHLVKSQVWGWWWWSCFLL